MEKWQEWENAADADWGDAVRREVVIRPLSEEIQLRRPMLVAAADELGLSPITIYRLVKRYKQRPQTSSLLPWKRGRSAKSQFLDPAREDLIGDCIKQVYLVPERPSLATLFQEIKRRFAEQQLPSPNYQTVRRRVAALDARLVIRKREGSKAAREQLGPVGVSTLRPGSPLDTLQIDHTLVDVIVVDQQKHLPIGRPWLSLAIDIATRTVAGFYISLEAPSALSVSLVLSHAVLPKAQWLADRELQTLNWPVGGLPRSIHLDNAKEFHSEALLRGCREYGIHIDHRPPGQPHFGGHIERLIGTMMGAVHLLPGTTFSNVVERGSYDAEGRAALTLPELERWIALQIAGVYHLSEHSALGKTPLVAWQDGVAQRKQPIRYPANTEEFFWDFLPAVARQIRRDGIHFHKLRYWDGVLSPWAGRLKEPLLVKYDPRNLSKVFVRDPNGQHWPIPYAELGQPPIALWELVEARKRLRRGAAREQTELTIFANILNQRHIVANAVSRSKQRRRQERIPTEEAKQAESPIQTSGSAEMKPYHVEIWEDE